MGAMAMFPKVDALPGAKRQACARKRNGKVHGGERGANVRRHVVVTLFGVAEERVAVRNKAGEESFEVAANFRIGIFLNEQRSRSVLDVECDCARLQLGVVEKRLHLIGKFVEAASAGLEFDVV